MFMCLMHLSDKDYTQLFWVMYMWPQNNTLHLSMSGNRTFQAPFTQTSSREFSNFSLRFMKKTVLLILQCELIFGLVLLFLKTCPCWATIQLTVKISTVKRTEMNLLNFSLMQMVLWIWHLTKLDFFCLFWTDKFVTSLSEPYRVHNDIKITLFKTI